MDCPKQNAQAGLPLPEESMLEILARTPFRSLCRSKCVAKAWRDLINDPLNRRRLPQTLQGFFYVPNRMANLEHFFIKYSEGLVPVDIDPSLSFLMKMKLPETESVNFVDSCNGLLLFRHYLKSHDVLGYIVCNPATKHWGTIPLCGRCPPREARLLLKTYLVFDPAVSSHFHLIQFWKGAWNEEAPLAYEEIRKLVLSVHTYSSETGVWSQSQTDWNEQGQLEGWRRQGIPKYGWHQRTFINGILHLMVRDQDQYQIVAVDVQGKTKRIIATPDAVEGGQWYANIPCIGQSQGRLHYINEGFDAHDSRQVQSSKLSVWELQDCDTQEWLLKDNVSFLSLFGTMTTSWNFVVMHPDRNVLFFLQPLNFLIAYDMDRKQVSVVFMSNESLEREIVPYIPYFSESPALTNKD